MLKKCCRCKQEKYLSEYHNSKSSKDGLQKKCKECNRECAKKYYKDNEHVKVKDKERSGKRISFLRKLIDSIKSKYGCCLCDEKDACCLDFHHVDPSTKIKTIAYLVSTKGTQKIAKEINKCILVCANCHRKIHNGSKIITVEPGYVNTDLIENFQLIEEKLPKPIKEKIKIPRKTKIEWPEYSLLKKMVEDTNFSACGKILGVSDNAVRRRLKEHAPVV